jgi:hypothetical protein
MLSAGVLAGSLLAWPALAQSAQGEQTQATVTATAPATVGSVLDASAEDRSFDGIAPERQTPRRYKRPSLDDRIKALTKTLDLNETQQSELRKVLESQRDRARKLWSDPSVPAGHRVREMQAINENTVARIRGLLNEEQKKKYFAPRPPESTDTSPKPSLDDWLNATRQQK